VVETVWTVRAAAGGEPRSGRTLAREPLQGSGFDALAAAHSRALVHVSSDIAAAIRAEAIQTAEVTKGSRPKSAKERKGAQQK
jgi:hypothetical protein